MLTSKKIIFITIPAIFLVIFAIFIQVLIYEPQFPKEDIESYEEQVNQEIIPIFSHDPIIGEKKSPKTIIAFSDLSCAACADSLQTLKQLMTKHQGKIKIIYKGLPVNKIPYPSENALRYAYCANQQKKFSSFVDLAYANYISLSTANLKTISNEAGLEEKTLEKCLSSAEPNLHIQDNKQLAKILQIQSVPTYFYDDNQINTPASIEGWEAILGL